MSLNTTPRTWVAGEVVTAAHLNTEVRDALAGVQAAWTAYGSASSFTAAGGGFALGNGTWLGRYQRIGKTIDFYVKVTLGSTTTVGSGNYRIELPVQPHASDPGMWTVVVADASTGAYYMGTVFTWTGTTASLAVINPAGGIQQVTPTVPMTVFAGDFYIVRGRYEAAS